ncbi:MAG: chromate transporter [Paludibacteraceae bacterium]|jgi:chromate transporter|nr:chromate transporter [Paludibacteraceae bacterium]
MLLDLFIAFFKIGAFTFGGGYAMISVIEQEVVTKKKWLSETDFVDMLAMVQSLPGPISINSSVYVGYKLKGVLGAIVAAIGTALPSFVIILLLAIVFTDVQDHPTIEKVFKGIRPAVVALIVAPLVRLSQKSGITYKNVIIPIAAALLVWQLDVSPIYIIIVAATGGLLYNWNKNKKK